MVIEGQNILDEAQHCEIDKLLQFYHSKVKILLYKGKMYTSKIVCVEFFQVSPGRRHFTPLPSVETFFDTKKSSLRSMIKICT